MKIEQRYLSLNQAAVYLGLSPKTLYKWAELDQIPAHKLGKLWRFDLQELDAFVKTPGNEHYHQISSSLPGMLINDGI